MGGVGVTRPVEEGVRVYWCDVAFYFFGSISIKVSCVNLGYVRRVVRMCSKSVKKFIEVTFVGEIYTPVRWNVSL